MCPFDYMAFAVSGKVGIPLTTPVGLLVTPTDRPKSVRNRCVIEVFGGVCVCCPLVFEFSVGIRGFVIGLGQISFFFSLDVLYGQLYIGYLKVTFNDRTEMSLNVTFSNKFNHSFDAKQITLLLLSLMRLHIC